MAQEKVQLPLLTHEYLDYFLRQHGVKLETNNLNGQFIVTRSRISTADQSRVLDDSNIEDRMIPGCKWKGEIADSTFVEDLPAILLSQLRMQYRGCSIDTISRFLRICAGYTDRRYLPPLRWLAQKGKKWDGHDRLPQLYELMHIENDELSKVLVHKWLLQCAGLLQNNDNHPIQAEGVLTLVGDEGWGKTALFRKLAIYDDWYISDQVAPSDKDHERRLVTRWISQLSEVQRSINAKTAEHIKDLITANWDTFRLPYAAKDTIRPRYTSFCASCNSKYYLVANVGYRRWFTIPLTAKISYDAIQAFDVGQLWGQIYNESTSNGWNTCFRLTESELQQLMERNKHFVHGMDSHEQLTEIVESIRMTSNNIKDFQVWTTFDQLRTQYSARNRNKNITREEVRVILKRQGIIVPDDIKQKKLNGINGRWFPIGEPLTNE